jgi:hypothetical protein
MSFGAAANAHKGPCLDPNRSYVNQSFSEHIDPFNGSVQLHDVDINIPGNGALHGQLQRNNPGQRRCH